MTVGEDDFLNLHPEDLDHPSGLLRRERFNAWKFLDDLVHHGPEYFRRFAKIVTKPESIEQIPVVKSRQVPARMMDISPSTPAQNADNLADLFRQGGVGDPAAPGSRSNVIDIADRVVLVHGDLLTGERIQSLQASRSEETSPWRRYQFVIYVMGLFHLKMACADAIWRIFIQAKGAGNDKNSLINLVGQLRPKETKKIEVKPGFRRMHEVIQHVGTVQRLDCWRVEVSKLDRHFTSLEAFAASKPDLDQIQRMAETMISTYVANDSFAGHRHQSEGVRDKENENLLLMQQYFLLYQEITYALNIGDIGRVEDCFMPWIFIFRGCGKHKYATNMMKYLRDVHFIYPPGLKYVDFLIQVIDFHHLNCCLTLGDYVDFNSVRNKL